MYLEPSLESLIEQAAFLIKHMKEQIEELQECCFQETLKSHKYRCRVSELEAMPAMAATAAKLPKPPAKPFLPALEATRPWASSTEVDQVESTRRV